MLRQSSLLMLDVPKLTKNRWPNLTSVLLAEMLYTQVLNTRGSDKGWMLLLSLTCFFTETLKLLPCWQHTSVLQNKSGVPYLLALCNTTGEKQDMVQDLMQSCTMQSCTMSPCSGV